jgi:excisionase family DNA binding protein
MNMAREHEVGELAGHTVKPPKTPVLAMGRVELSCAVSARADDALTLDEVASLLKLPSAAVRQRAEHGDLPGRRFGSEWRFSKVAVLSWLADGDKPRGPRRR